MPILSHFLNCLLIASTCRVMITIINDLLVQNTEVHLCTCEAGNMCDVFATLVATLIQQTSAVETTWCTVETRTSYFEMFLGGCTGFTVVLTNVVCVLFVDNTWKLKACVANITGATLMITLENEHLLLFGYSFDIVKVKQTN